MALAGALLGSLLALAGAHAGCDPLHPPGPYDIVNPNAGLVEEAGDPGCPAGMARIENFCIDRYHATLMEEQPDGSEAYWSPYHNPGDRKMRAVSLEGAVPQGYISGAQAQRACLNAGKRLCADAEFLRACRGQENWTYPYAPVRYPKGTSPAEPACNESRAEHPVLELFPNDPHPFSHLGNACINQLEHTVSRTGSYSRCRDAEGVYDLMGNLHEWMGSPDPKTGKGRFRGGYYMDTHINGEGCLYLTHAHKFTYWDYSTGFRCCADVR